MLSVVLFWLLHFKLTCSQSSEATKLASAYPSNTWMNEARTFRLWWKFIPKNAGAFDMIEFAMEANTTGWVSMGISPNGQMPNSDIAVGWVSNGQAVIQDRNSFGGRVDPAVDSLQNVTLVSGQEVGGWTIIKFRRPLAVCDPKDVAIGPGSTRVLFAYSPSNKDGPSIDFHGRGIVQKGSKTINLDSTGRPVPSRPAGTTTINLTFSNYLVPTQTTTYACQLFELPLLQNKVHVIEMLPKIQANTSNVVHHMLMYACPPSTTAAIAANTGNSATLAPHTCGSHNMAEVNEGCYGALLVYSWAVGGSGQIFPSEAGLPLGGNNSIRYVLIETHYDNPQHLSTIRDSSGVSVVYTPTLRRYDAGSIWAGLAVDPRAQWIPPNWPAGELLWQHAWLPASCLSAAMAAANVSKLHVIFSFLHMHNLGRSIRIRHIRNGVELKPIDNNPTYDFDFQQSVPINHTVILPGDDLLLECGYSSAGVSQMTYGGTATLDEMCMFFFTIYPTIALEYVGQWWNFDTTYASLMNTAVSSGYLTYDTSSKRVQSFQTSNPKARQFYLDLYASNKTHPQRYTRCKSGNTNYMGSSSSFLSSYPRITSVYVPPSVSCDVQKTTTKSPMTTTTTMSSGVRAGVMSTLVCVLAGQLLK